MYQTRHCTTEWDSEGQAIPWNDGEVVNAMGQWIVDAMRFQKIYGLNTAECHTVEKWSGRLGSGWVWWVWWVCVGDGWVVSGSVDSGCQKLSENIWFVWSKTSHSGDKWRCYRCGTGQTTSEDRATQLLIWETLSLAIVNGLVWYSWYGLDGSEFTAIYQSQYTGRYIAARIVAVIFFRKIFWS